MPVATFQFSLSQMATVDLKSLEITNTSTSALASMCQKPVRVNPSASKNRDKNTAAYLDHRFFIGNALITIKFQTNTATRMAGSRADKDVMSSTIAKPRRTGKLAAGKTKTVPLCLPDAEFFAPSARSCCKIESHRNAELLRWSSQTSAVTWLSPLPNQSIQLGSP